MGILKKYYFVFAINLILFIILVLTGCQKANNTASEVSMDVSKLTGSTVPGTNQPYYDSTDVYGKGYYDYQDTLDTFHDGYNIPRDSIYKVYNIHEWEKNNYLGDRDSLSPEASLDRGNHLQNIKLYEEAIRDYDRYIAQVKTNNSAYHNRGNAHERLKHYQLALRDYDTAIFIRPDDTIAYFNKGVVYDYIQQYDSSLIMYTKVIEIDPRLAKAYYNRGVIYKLTGQYREAMKDWEIAMRLNPKYIPELSKEIDRIKIFYK
ncbi:MAG: tetratricopeptide repeat protein [Ignavibacteriae bacterium]|nr:tetratricopeptide repeat protein [Ignavibacteriota bacterium]